MGNSDSHASFHDGIKRLLLEDVSYDDREFWSTLFTAPMSVEEVFEIISSPDYIRQLRQKRPRNIQVFLHMIIEWMSSICRAAEEAVEQNSRGMPPHMLTAANTVIRLLTRIMPLLLEDQDDEVVRDILWRPGGYDQKVEPAAAEPAAAEGEPAAAEGDASPSAESPSAEKTSSEAELPAANGSSAKTDRSQLVCGYEILNYINRFLFLPFYTVTPRSKITGREHITEKPDARIVWKGGIGLKAAGMSEMNCSPQTTRARAEVLRCLLLCLSGPLFQTSDEYQDVPSLWLLRVAGGEVAHTANLFCSLMATVFSYDHVGWGLPYGVHFRGGYFAFGSEEDLVDMSLQVLCVLMDFDPIEERAVMIESLVAPKSTEESPSKRRPRNVYRYMLQNVSDDAQIDLIYSGIVRLLSTVHQANHTYLPNSFRQVGFYQEALVLLWHLMTLNASFLRRLVTVLDTNQILLPALYLLQQAQNAPQLVGLLHTVSFILLVLSSERSFSVRLNEPYNSKMPLTIPNFKGCYADVLTLTLHKVISDGLMKPQNDALIEMLLTVLCNISPYIKSYALESCLKLLSLIERCSRPVYLFKSAFAQHGLIFLLELLNNVVQYQYEGNTMLVYSILRQKEVIKRLVELKLPARYEQEKDGAEPDGAEKDGAEEEGDPSLTEGTSLLEAQAPPPEDTDAPPPVNRAETNGGAETTEASAEAAADAPDAAEDGGDAAAADTAEEESGELWTPTAAWLASWKKKMPLQALTCLIDYLAPEIEAMCKENDVTDQDEVLNYLKRTTMVGILPVPHPIVIRTYQASSYTAMWFTSYMWGVIFTRSQRLPLYDWKKIKLVVINQ